MIFFLHPRDHYISACSVYAENKTKTKYKIHKTQNKTKKITKKNTLNTFTSLCFYFLVTDSFSADLLSLLYFSLDQEVSI